MDDSKEVSEQQIQSVTKDNLATVQTHEGLSTKLPVKQRMLLKELKARSLARRKVLAHQFADGNVESLRQALGIDIDDVYNIRGCDTAQAEDSAQRPKKSRQESGQSSQDGESTARSRASSGGGLSAPVTDQPTKLPPPLPQTKSDRADGENVTIEAEEQIYVDSKAFLKGTQSANPHNDYCQHFVDTGQRPQNFIRDVGLADRFEEYPKLKELIKLKDELMKHGHGVRRPEAGQPRWT